MSDTIQNKPKMNSRNLDHFIISLYQDPERKQLVIDDLSKRGFREAVLEYFVLNDHQKRELQTIDDHESEVIVTNAVLAALRRNGKIELIQEGHNPPNMKTEVGFEKEGEIYRVYVRFTC